MKEYYKFENAVEVIVNVSILTEFDKCIKDESSPFKHGQAVGVTGNKTIFIKCIIEESEKSKILKQTAVSGDMICHEIANRVVKKQYPLNPAVLAETLMCNHFEHQYKYVIK